MSYIEREDSLYPDESFDLIKSTVVGHKIVESFFNGGKGRLKLDNGVTVSVAGTSDCCAWGEVDNWLLHPENVDHVITDVVVIYEDEDEAETSRERWMIIADMNQLLDIDISYYPSNGYYMYGFWISVERES